MSIEPNWYFDPGNPKLQRYWDGDAWQAETKPAGTFTLVFPDPSVAAPPRRATRPGPPSRGGFSTAAQLIYVLAALSAIGGVAAGAALIVHSVPNCGANPFNPSLTLCSGNDHPFRAAGVFAIVGGLIQAAVLAVVGRLCIVVGDLRAWATQFTHA